MSASSHSSPFVKYPGCGEKLRVGADAAGRRGQCHACGKVFRIGAPPGAATSGAHEPAATPSPTSAAASAAGQSVNVYDNAHLHPVVCEVCQTLTYATDDQVGTMLKCPDCGHRNLATPRPHKHVVQTIVPDGEEYQLDESDRPPPTPVILPIEVREAQFRAAARARLGRPTAVDDDDPDDSNERQARPADGAAIPKPRASAAAASAKKSRRGGADPRRPAVPVVQGVTRMLLSAELTVRWAALSLTLTWISFLVLMVLGAMGNQALYALPLFAGGCMLGGLWLMSAAPLLIAIVTQSSDGNDELYDAPNWIAFDIAEAMFFVMAVMISAVPAWLATKAAAGLPEEAALAVAAGVWLLVFPFVMLSSLEQGSPLAVFSPRLASSLVRCFVPWLAFYVASTAVVAGTAWLAAYLGARGSWLALLPIPWMFVALLLTYMRMLGRLGWWIADVMPPPDEAKNE